MLIVKFLYSNKWAKRTN